MTGRLRRFTALATLTAAAHRVRVVRVHLNAISRLALLTSGLISLLSIATPSLAQAQNLDALYKQYQEEYQAGRYAEAERLARQAVDLCEKQFGRNRFRCAWTLANLANVYRAQGRHGEAMPLYKRVLELNEKALRGGTPKVAMAVGNLADANQTQPEAEPPTLSAKAIEPMGPGKESIIKPQDAIAFREGMRQLDQFERMLEAQPVENYLAREYFPAFKPTNKTERTPETGAKVTAPVQPADDDPRFEIIAGLDLYGADIRGMPLHDVSLDDCKAACLKEQNCRGFTFNENAQTCFLKSGAGERKPFAGAISGLRRDFFSREREIGYVIQVAASKDRSGFLAMFAQLQRRYPKLMGKYRPIIERADLGAKGVWYRLRIGPIGTMSAAVGLCAKLETAGVQGCFVLPD